MEGPAFSTVAESRMHRAWGGDLIGMTCMPEAKLAREAEICYAMVALPTDYDCWRPREGHEPAEALLAEILRNLQSAADNAIVLLRHALRLIHAERGSAPSTPPIGSPGEARPCTCRDALKLAIWSDRGQIDAAIRKRLEPLIGRYVVTDKHGDGD
jgi:5'-methylthioadenosine phosphorylase